MENASKYAPIEGAVIQAIVLVDRVTRPDPGRFESQSTPGHLLQFVIEGEVEQTADGRRQHLHPGLTVWHHDSEAISGQILSAPWSFYTVGFRALRLPPPTYDARVRPASPRAGACFETLLEAWRDEGSPLRRHMRSLAALHQLLLEAFSFEAPRQRSDQPSQLWWEIEARVREDLSRPINLRWLQRVSGRSARCVSRACTVATGMSPMKRVKELRLRYARGRVRYSEMSITEIALELGYERVQELSRDYHRRFGVTPREDRQSEPEYKTQHVPSDERDR